MISPSCLSMNMAGGSKLKFAFSFMKTTHQLLRLDLSFYSDISWACLQVLIESQLSLMELLYMAMVGRTNF
jgi:hypothetical protein